MDIIAESKYVRMTPRKLRLVADLVRDLSLFQAIEVLENLNKRAARPILETLKQGVGNAVNNFELVQESLNLKKIEIGEGPTLKRWQAVSRGRAHQIKKRTSHIKIILSGDKRVAKRPPKIKRSVRDKTRVKNKKTRKTGAKRDKRETDNNDKRK